MRALGAAVLALATAAAAYAGELANGVLTADGRPFYPLGSWMGDPPEHVAQLGMNAVFVQAPSSEGAAEAFRPRMRRFAELGIQVIPYISYGGSGAEPWPPDAVRAAAGIADEPNLLVWYVGDDIMPAHLPGIRQTVSILREQTPFIPTVADYIAEETPEARTTFTEYVDIRCQYNYPIFSDPLPDYLNWFEQQRRFVGDPLWTWIQCFQWGNQVRPLDMGKGNGAGPVPEPEQVRLMSYVAINRGVRGLLFFSHDELIRLPELAGEVALVCREVRLFEDLLAAGRPTYDLATSDPVVRATSFEYDGSLTVAAVVLKPFYHRWVDEGVMRNVTIRVPWSGRDLPEALLLDAPDVVQCPVSRVSADTVGVTLPSLELAGLVLVSADQERIAALRAGAARMGEDLRRVMVTAAASQTRKIAGLAWQAGWENHTERTPHIPAAARMVDSCANAVVDGRYADAVRHWRGALRTSRCVSDSLMRFVEARRDMIPPQLQRYMATPYTIRYVRNFQEIPSPDDPWRIITEFDITGPFPLEWDGTWFTRESDGRLLPTLPTGFDRPYPPESQASGPYPTLDGAAGWSHVYADASGLLDFVPHFRTIDNVVCYARTTITAPREMDAVIGLGSNDGAKMWVNGAEVFNRNDGRDARPRQDEIPVHLRAGRNEILVKVSNLGGRGWKLMLCAHDPERELLFGD